MKKDTRPFMQSMNDQANETILTGLEIVGRVFCKFALERFELRGGDGATGAADA